MISINNLILDEETAKSLLSSLQPNRKLPPDTDYLFTLKAYLAKLHDDVAVNTILTILDTPPDSLPILIGNETIMSLYPHILLWRMENSDISAPDRLKNEIERLKSIRKSPPFIELLP